MRELKALEILKIFQSRLGASKEILENDEYELQLWDAIDEAIEELEALQAPKTCEGCKQKHNDGFCNVIFNAQLFDNTDKTVAVYIEAMDGFSCSYYEPKDNQ